MLQKSSFSNSPVDSDSRGVLEEGGRSGHFALGPKMMQAPASGAAKTGHPCLRAVAARAERGIEGRVRVLRLGPGRVAYIQRGWSWVTLELK